MSAPKLNLLTDEQHHLLLQLFQLLSQRDVPSVLDRKWILEEEILKKFRWDPKVLQRARKNEGLKYVRKGLIFIYDVDDFNNWLNKFSSTLPLPRGRYHRKN